MYACNTSGVGTLYTKLSASETLSLGLGISKLLPDQCGLSDLIEVAPFPAAIMKQP